MKIRRYFRQPLVQTALLKLPDTGEFPCEIRNFCQAGLLLKITGPDSESKLPRERNGAEVVFTPAGSDTTHRMAGRLSHVSADGVGFVFGLAPPFQVLQALQRKALTQPPAERPPSAEQAEIHGHCLQALENALYPLLDKLPAQIQTDLAEAMDKTARAGPGKTPDDDASPLLEQDSRPIIESFYAHALEQARSFVVPDLSLQPEPGAVYSESQFQRLAFED